LVRPVLWKNRNGLQPALHLALCSEHSQCGPLDGLPGSQGHSCQTMGTGGLFPCKVGCRVAGGAAGLGWTLAAGQDVPFLLHGKAGADATTQGGTQTQNLALGSLARRGQGSVPLQGTPAAPTGPVVPGS